MWQNCINTVEHTLYLYIIYISILWDKRSRIPFGYDAIVCSLYRCECVKVQSSGLTAEAWRPPLTHGEPLHSLQDVADHPVCDARTEVLSRVQALLQLLQNASRQVIAPLLGLQLSKNRSHDGG